MKNAFLVGLLLVCACMVVAEEKKIVGSLLVETTAPEIAREFKENPTKAEAKYKTPEPPMLGGAIIELNGMVDGVGRKDKFITLKTDSNIKVVIYVPKLPDIDGQIAVTISGGVYKSFAKNCLVITAGEVKYARIIGKKD